MRHRAPATCLALAAAAVSLVTAADTGGRLFAENPLSASAVVLPPLPAVLRPLGRAPEAPAPAVAPSAGVVAPAAGPAEKDPLAAVSPFLDWLRATESRASARNDEAGGSDAGGAAAVVEDPFHGLRFPYLGAQPPPPSGGSAVVVTQPGVAAPARGG